MLFHPTKFWNYMARGYARRPVKDTDAYQYKLDKTASYIGPQDHVLEIGCGTGTTALIHAAKAEQIDAIDFSSEMIAIARNKAVAQGIANVNFQISSIEDWPLPKIGPKGVPEGGKSYDHVLAMSVLHLVTNLDNTLERIYRLMKPGARFFSSTVCIGEMNGIVRYALLPLGAIGLLPKILPLTSDMLQKRLLAHGFTVEHVWRPNDGAVVFMIAQKAE